MKLGCHRFVAQEMCVHEHVSQNACLYAAVVRLPWEPRVLKPTDNRQGLTKRVNLIMLVGKPGFTYTCAMRLNDTLEKAFNDQLTLEMQASNVYRQLAIELDLLDLSGMSAWMRAQAEEEIQHAEKFIAHLANRDNRAQIGTIEKPDVKVGTAIDAFRLALEHEKKVSESIRNLYQLAADEGDIDSRPLLDFFLNEQIEEEDTVRTIVGRLEMVADDGSGILRIDRELAMR